MGEREDVGTALLLQGLGVDGQETSQPCILLLASSWKSGLGWGTKGGSTAAAATGVVIDF